MNYDNTLTTAELDITSAAQIKLGEIVAGAEDETSGIRIYMSGGGCGGMASGMTYATEATEFDKTRQYDDYAIYVDVVALSYLYGVEIDYIKDAGRERFVFNNLFAAMGGSGACGGCGSAQ